VQRSECLDVADVVEDHEAPADRGEHPDLTALHRHIRRNAVQQAAPLLEDVVQRSRVRDDAVASGLRGDLLPDLVLGRARRLARREGLAHPLVLEAAQLRMGCLRGGGERLGVAPVVPATLLDAAHRHRQRAARRHQDRDVEDAVLLGAEDLLALVQEHGQLGGVVDDQVVDGRAAGQLLDRDAATARLSEGDVLERWPRGGDQREDRQPPDHIELGHRDRRGQPIGEGGWCRVGAGHRTPLRWLAQMQSAAWARF
jgi:hypothetical protein